MRNADLWERARRSIPGGVNSPVRSFRSVGSTPFFVSSGSGPYLTDVDGRRYIDYVLSWGPLILGHAHSAVIEALAAQLDAGTSYGAPTEAEVELAERVVRLVPSVEMVRLVNSGTEATMSALRLARAATGRDVVVKFSGCYHGHADAFLVAAGSGVATLGLPDSPGVPAVTAAQTAVLPFNDLDAVEDLLAQRGSEIAAVFLEPVVGNSGLIPPLPGFLEGLRALTTKHGALLVFDEVMTGFRVALGGAQERYGVMPDLTTLGKVIGGGLPVGAFGGSADLMKLVAPAGSVYQAGTLSGNPLATAAGIAQLRYLEDNDPFDALAAAATRLADGMVDALRAAGLPATGRSVGSMWGVFFHEGPIHSFEDAQKADTAAFSCFHAAALERGVFLAPSPYEVGFVSTVHTSNVVDQTLAVFREAALAVAGSTDEPRDH
ncbi:MAG: glutamate-1-semialdehyde 2,1-aminomutase [Gemmatimonadota bacterium]|nr:MAG: glutamate-1-semialdehyde 2,1-aminomutase [Gemmatimonadota bacterium]